MSTLKVTDLHVSVTDEEEKTEREILKGVDLTINTGETHAIMGPNGTGKSTLSETIMGNPNYIVTQGDVTIDGESILGKPVDERARLGLFLAMQYPAEIKGITNAEFMRAAINSRRADDDQISIRSFLKELDKNIKTLNMTEEMTERYLNEGFSGGEKKRNEILQLMMIKPKFAILDEIDSGLDIDALQVVAQGVNEMASPDFGTLMITHYQRLLNYIHPDQVHVMMDGRIVKTGDASLAEELEEKGYAGLRDELGIDANLVDDDVDQTADATGNGDD
ncbi:Fe-S cluster assembly ATPase SufC [Paucilactobacillus suebicus]|uniref:ABC transporter, ATP-binding protein n=1 Tax=Paucilactobacillus suebicus DSM 5007 = KCTC 3549 TaxID=1423807 RepID=A0A0R1W644_9LACO|nr:Fe-S cluster assembly ATPase SufC [Paucilactobacillus suebicus]KRM13005.1 ABC transporter, ATP-binding protein [Paucilactobacillus suebicus DSM 5007 = KCTC 3549]